MSDTTESDISSLLSKPIKLECYFYAASNTKNSFMKKYGRKLIRLRVAYDCNDLIRKLIQSAAECFRRMPLHRLTYIVHGALKILLYQVDSLYGDICKLMRAASKKDSWVNVDEGRPFGTTVEYTLDIVKEQHNRQLLTPVVLLNDSNVMWDGEDLAFECRELQRQLDDMLDFGDTPAQALEYIADDEEFWLSPKEIPAAKEQTVGFDITEAPNRENEPTGLEMLPAVPPIEETIPNSIVAAPIEVEIPDARRSGDVTIPRQRSLIVDKVTEIRATTFAKRLRQCYVNTKPLTVIRVASKLAEDLLAMPAMTKPNLGKTLLNQWNRCVQECWIPLQRDTMQYELVEDVPSNEAEQLRNPVIEETSNPVVPSDSTLNATVRKVQDSRQEERTIGLSDLTILQATTVDQRSIHSLREEIVDNFEMRQDHPTTEFGDEIERGPLPIEGQPDPIASPLSLDISELPLASMSRALELFECHTTQSELVLFSDLVRSSKSDLKGAIWLFLSYLGLAKRKKITLHQRKPFDDLWVQRYYYHDSEQ